MSDYNYLDVKLILEKPEEVTPVFFKKNILEAVKQLFGEVATAVNIDVLKFNAESLQGIIRVPKSHYIKIRGSITLCGKFEGQQCIYLIQKCSSLLLALQGDSRDYSH